MIDFDMIGVRGSEYDDDGFLALQGDHYGEDKSGRSASEAHSPYGLYGRPADPDVDADGTPTAFASMLIGDEGNVSHTIPLGDPRLTDKLPRLKKGEVIVYGGRGQFTRYHEDGSIAHFTTDGSQANFLDGRAVYNHMGPDGHDLVHPEGRITLGADGVHITTSSGARIDMGPIGGLTGPIASMSSWIELEAQMISIKASIISLGTDGGAGNEAAVSALAVLVLQIIDAIALITTVSPGVASLASVGLNAGVIAALHTPAGLPTLLAPIGKVV